MEQVKIKLTNQRTGEVSYLGWKGSKKWLLRCVSEEEALVFSLKPYKDGASYYIFYLEEYKHKKHGLRLDYHTGAGDVFGSQHESTANSWKIEDNKLVPRIHKGGLAMCPSDEDDDPNLYVSLRLEPFIVEQIPV
ncbi:hypothetical protein [Aureivirga sp. CE67]|uniref:hypothetical protein n=1 Tax=Aureivirga sp. CE67 TaxID=1788983 RepID=UPI0018CBEA97|nr:hypothetical protein [Aureivirga sp. CE67]